MQTSAQYKARPQFALLLMGAPFAGKTNVAFQFPDPYVLDCDDKLINAVNRHPNKEFFFDCPMRDDKGLPVPLDFQWERAQACLKQAAASPKVKTIIIDSITTLSPMIINHILRFPGTGKNLMVGGERVMDKSMWMPYRDIFTKLIMGLRSTGKFIIFIAHDTNRENDNGQIVKTVPSFAGQLADNGAGLFTDHWHCETEQVIATNGKPSYQYYIRTAPKATMPLGTSLGLPDQFVFTWDLIEKHFNKIFTVEQPTPVAA